MYNPYISIHARGASYLVGSIEPAVAANNSFYILIYLKRDSHTRNCFRVWSGQNFRSLLSCRK